MITAATVPTITGIDRAEWDRCFPGELEGWAYYAAVEHAGLDGFDLLYFTLRQDGTLIAAVPAFTTTYRLDATVQGCWKRVTERLARCLPRLLAIDLLALGSPVGEICHLGFAPNVPVNERPTLLASLLAEMAAEAERRGIGLMAIKDAAVADPAWVALPGAGFRRFPGLPTAFLPLPFADRGAYLDSLSSATRKDLRRKLKAAAAVRIEWRDRIDDIAPQVMALYEETRARSDLQLERLDVGYFTGILAAMPGRASCVLYWLGEELAGFNFVLHDRDRLIDKFFGTREGLDRKVNLYHLSWLENVRYCLEAGVPTYQSGQALYREKLRLGSSLSLNYLWFRHRNRTVDAILGLVSRFVRPDRFDADLAAAYGRAE